MIHLVLDDLGGIAHKQPLLGLKMLIEISDPDLLIAPCRALPLVTQAALLR